MFGIDFSEILVIFGIALVVLGPEKLPKLANTIGRWVGRARGMARQFREQLEQETNTLKRSVDLGPEFGGHGAGTPQAQPAPAAQAAQARAAGAAAHAQTYTQTNSTEPASMPGAVPLSDTGASVTPAVGVTPVFSPSAIDAIEEYHGAQLELEMAPPTAELAQPAAAPAATTHAAGAPTEPRIPLHESVWPDDGPV
jgi:sec-independent protein translocase protein TatB